MTKAVKERFGSIDALVNNAGITKDGLMARMSEEQYDAVIAVNQKSVFKHDETGGYCDDAPAPRQNRQPGICSWSVRQIRDRSTIPHPRLPSSA